MNNAVRSSLRSERGKTESGSRPALCVDLDKLAEEVVESVLAGWSYRNMSGARFAAWYSFMQGSPRLSGDSASSSDGLAGPHRPSMQHGKTGTPVQIFLDIDNTVNWSFRTHPGAFRRVILNLFGNSLKFTKDGFIRVSMKQDRGDYEHHDGTLGGQHQTSVILTISDSGKGISQDYLGSQLFTPFSQEDHFAPGTGLGLSLVRQMVASLGGTIDVLSHVGQGTTITVTLPLFPYVPNGSEVPGSASNESDSGFINNLKDLAGKRIHLLGFEKILAVREGIFGQEDSKEKSQFQLLESVCRGWLKMDVVLPRPQKGKMDACQSMNPENITEGDYVLSFGKSHATRSPKDGSAGEGPGDGPQLVVCRDSDAMYAFRKESGEAGEDGGASSIAEP